MWINIANCFNDWLRFDCIWSVDKFIKSDLNSFLITPSRSLSLRFISRSLPASREKKAKTNNKMKWNLIAQRGPLECSATAFSIWYEILMKMYGECGDVSLRISSRVLRAGPLPLSTQLQLSAFQYRKKFSLRMSSDTVGSYFWLLGALLSHGEGSAKSSGWNF